MISNEIKSKIRGWNRADAALFDAINVEFWRKIEKYGNNTMQLQIEELHKRIDNMMKFCVADLTTFIPKWSEVAIEIGCLRIHNELSESLNFSKNASRRYENFDIQNKDICFNERWRKI